MKGSDDYKYCKLMQDQNQGILIIIWDKLALINFVHFVLENNYNIPIFHLVIFLSHVLYCACKRYNIIFKILIGGIQMKIKAIILSLVVGATLLVGCGTKETKTTSAPVATKTDVVTTASIVNEQTAFQKAASKEGTWIIAITQDLKVDKEIVLEGSFMVADKVDATKKVPAGRKLALYNQDDKHFKTAIYTLTAPKLIVKSENSKIQGGIFVGDVYVEAKGFTIKDAKVQGNVYFATNALKSAFKLDKTGFITGKTEVKK